MKKLLALSVVVATGCASSGGGGPVTPGVGILPVPTSNGPSGLLPDLTVDQDLLAGNGGYPAPHVSFENRAPDDCAVVEGCIVSGNRKVLKFNVGVANVGDVDLNAPDPATDPEDFEWSPCHQHYHYKGFAQYTLSDASGVVATGRKQAFCLMDIQDYGSPNNPDVYYDCGNQGISVGWEDVYDESLDCQWIDVTDLSPGDYTLSVTVNAQHRLQEKGAAPDTATVPVTIQ